MNVELNNIFKNTKLNKENLNILENELEEKLKKEISKVISSLLVNCVIKIEFDIPEYYSNLIIESKVSIIDFCKILGIEKSNLTYFLITIDSNTVEDFNNELTISCLYNSNNPDVVLLEGAFIFPGILDQIESLKTYKSLNISKIDYSKLYELTSEIKSQLELLEEIKRNIDTLII